MEKIIDLIIGSIDFSFMLAVNVLTYFIIKIIDAMNGDKAVPTWLKRVVALLSGIILGSVVVITSGFTTTLVYSFILSLISWDALFKPILKRLKNMDYKKPNNGL